MPAKSINLLVTRESCDVTDLRALPRDADRGRWARYSLEGRVGVLRAPVDKGDGNGLEKLRLLEVRRRLVQSNSIAGSSGFIVRRLEAEHNFQAVFEDSGTIAAG